MSAHTPGPWRVDATYDPRGICILAGEARFICGEIDNDPDLADVELDVLHDMTPQEVFALRSENVANACVMAAAPDLLEALRMVRDADEDCKLDGFPAIPPLARAKIDAAIAKAEGSQDAR